MRENGADGASLSVAGRRRGRKRSLALLDELALKVCARLIGPSTRGRLNLTLPSGTSRLIGNKGAGDGIAHLTLRNYRPFRRSLRRGPLGFAESYLDGDIECPDLLALFGFVIDNRPRLLEASRHWFRVRAPDRAFHRKRANTLAGSRANIIAHYDLGNAFYRSWLDPELTYSSALFDHPGQTLEEAQAAKYSCVLDALDLRPGHRLLEIGCGWGALAVRAATLGAEVTGLTLSSEQVAAARARAGSRGLAERVAIRLQDYRDVRETYDRIVAIEMIEAVGEENWPCFFSILRDRIADDGTIVLQAITIAEPYYDRYRRQPDFIQRYIFPGGMLPTRALIERHARAAGLEPALLQAFGRSYALTLAHWRQRFHANWPAIKALGFDDRFRRMWDYYLAYCQAGFERGTIDVGIYRMVPRTG